MTDSFLSLPSLPSSAQVDIAPENSNEHMNSQTPSTPTRQRIVNPDHYTSSFGAKDESSSEDDEEEEEGEQFYQQGTPYQQQELNPFSVEVLKNNPSAWRPSYENQAKVNTKLAQIKKRIAEATNVTDNPLVKLAPNSKYYKSLVDNHFKMMVRHLPAKVYLRLSNQSHSDSHPYALFEEVSENLTKYRFSFRGKDDYSTAAELYRDLFFAQFNTAPEPSKVFTDCVYDNTGWDYFDVWVDIDLGYLLDGRVLFDVSNFYDIACFHPAIFRNPQSATTYHSSKAKDLDTLDRNCQDNNNLKTDNDIVPRYFQSRNGIVKATTFDSRERYATFGELSFSGDGNKKTGEPTAKELYNILVHKINTMYVLAETVNEKMNINNSIKEEISQSKKWTEKLTQASLALDQVMFGDDTAEYMTKEASDNSKALLGSIHLALESDKRNKNGKKTNKRRRSKNEIRATYDSSDDEDAEFVTTRK